MSDSVQVGLDDRPRLAAHMRLRFDKARDSWTIQAPERVFMLDAIAHAIISRCDGETSITAIVDALHQIYDQAPRDRIEADVVALIQDFSDRRILAR